MRAKHLSIHRRDALIESLLDKLDEVLLQPGYIKRGDIRAIQIFVHTQHEALKAREQ